MILAEIRYDFLVKIIYRLHSLDARGIAEGKMKKKEKILRPSLTWRRAIFALAIFAAGVLNFCVRDGNRCVHSAIVTRSFRGFPQNWITVSRFVFLLCWTFSQWLNFRPISISQLNESLHLHPWPIYLVVFKGSYLIESMGNLILELVSRLDAFSVYPIRSQLSSCTTGVITGAP